MASWQVMKLPVARVDPGRGGHQTNMPCLSLGPSTWPATPGHPPPSPPPAEGLRSPASITLQMALLPGLVGGESTSFCLLLAGRWASGQRLGLRINLHGRSGTHTRKRAADP